MKQGPHHVHINVHSSAPARAIASSGHPRGLSTAECATIYCIRRLCNWALLPKPHLLAFAGVVV